MDGEEIDSWGKTGTGVWKIMGFGEDGSDVYVCVGGGEGSGAKGGRVTVCITF